MKKLLNILLILVVVFSFSACNFAIDLGGEDETKIEDEKVKDDEDTKVEEKEKLEEEKKADELKEEEDAKKDEEIKKLEEKVEDLESKIEEDKKTEEDKKSEEEKKPEAYSGENYITLNSPSNNADYYEEPIIFKGVVSPNTKKIVVTATNAIDGVDPDNTMGYYNDVYTLNDFDYGDSSFTYRAKMEWSNLFFGSNNYTFTAYFDDGTNKSAYVTVYYTSNVAEIGKPVIYLYPEETTKIFVDVDPTGGVSVSEPALNDGWNVIANSDGEILNLADYSLYPYLFYEGYSYDFETPEEGFVVAKEDVDSFFDEKLSVLGLNEKEIADFKEFWVPILSEDSYYFITFIPQEEFDDYAPLTVSPTPDSVIRIFFDYKGLEDPIEVTEQKLSTPVREGFSVIEWGGRLYK